MKLLKTLTVGLLAAASVGTASAAPTIIHVTGSSAFRTGTSIAIIDTLAGTTAGNGTGTTPVYAAYSDTSVAGAAAQIFANGTIGTNGTATIIIEATWTGSLAGVVDVAAASSTAAFLDETNATVQAAVNGTSTATVGNGGQVDTTGSTSVATSTAGTGSYLFYTATAGTETLGTGLGKVTDTGKSGLFHGGTVELAMSDSNQATIAKELATGTLSGSLGTAPLGPFTSITTLASTIGNTGTSANIVPAGTVASTLNTSHSDVGIVPFEWCVGNGYSTPSNITQQVARSLFQTGYVSQSFLTGKFTSADSSNYFYLVGRNEDSGTRIGALSESEFGVTGNPHQYQVGPSLSTFALNSIQQVAGGTALNTEPQISWGSTGHSGYATGGNVASALAVANNGASVSFTNNKAANNSGSSWFVGYLGVTDAASAIGKGAFGCSYNGVAYDPNSVVNGAYSFWTFEYAYRLKTLSGVTLTTVNNISDNLSNADVDVIYPVTGTLGLTHAFSSSDGVTFSYVTGSAGVFDPTLQGSRTTTEGAPVITN